MRKIAIVICLISVLSLLAACGAPADVAKPPMSSGAKEVKVTGKCEIAIENNVIKLKATTDLMDGTICRLSITGSGGAVLAKKAVTKQGDNLTAEFTVEKDWPSLVQGFLVAEPSADGQQNEQVIAKYGEKFENLTGENTVFNRDHVSFVVGSTQIDTNQK